VALGALQSDVFRRAVLLDAKYLISVSGGGYTAGAFQQVLTSAWDDEAVRDPETAFLPGTAEADHLRRHSSYLASSPRELLIALGLLVFHLLLTLFLLFAPAVLLGVARAPSTRPSALSRSASGSSRSSRPACRGPR